jgi:hypothetical protein
VRVVVYLLVAVNLVYLAWAGWIDAPPPLPAVKASDPLPELALLSEGIARSGSGSEQAGPSVVQTASALAEPVTGRANASGRCVSVGPFNDLAQAARAAALLRDRGLSSRQRAEQSGTWEGFWVSVGGLESAADEAKVMKALERAGIQDAQPMPATQGGRRISVGLFSERGRAERRAEAVKRLGFDAEISQRNQAGTVYWVDLDVGVNDRAIPTEGLLSLESSGSRLEIRVCPGVEMKDTPSRPLPNPRDARPAATTADAGVPRPG